MADQEQAASAGEIRQALRTGIRAAARKALEAAQVAVAEIVKAETDALAKVTPPDISEATAHKIKRQYPGDKAKAYATMWSIHNRIKKGCSGMSLGKAENAVGKEHQGEVDAMSRCPECDAPFKLTSDGQIPDHKVSDSGVACPGGGKQAAVKGGPKAPEKKSENGAGEAVEKAEGSKLCKSAGCGMAYGHKGGHKVKKNETMGYPEGGAPMAMAEPAGKVRAPKTMPVAPSPPLAKPRNAATMPVAKTDPGMIHMDAKVRGSVIDRQRRAAPAKPAPSKKSPAAVRGVPASMVQVSPEQKAEPMAKGPPPIPPAATKHPSSSPEGLPLVGAKIPPRVPPSVTGKIPAKLPGVAPVKQPGAGSLTPAAPLAPAPKGPQAPTMASVKVPGIHK